jgi:hypothetical protein
MEFTPITGKRTLAPPGFLSVKLGPELWQPYTRLHASYQAYVAGLPMLAERDFDGKRAVKLTSKQLEALNAAFTKLAAEAIAKPTNVFEAQEEARTRLFKRLQYLS